jgi:hypothetical protein
MNGEERDERVWEGIALRFVSAVESIAVSFGRIADAITKIGPTKIRLLFGSVNEK